MAQIIDGKARAEKLRAEIAKQTQELIERTGVVPGLAVVIVGEDPASQVYVRSKRRQATEAGFNSIHHELPAEMKYPFSQFGTDALGRRQPTT